MLKTRKCCAKIASTGGKGHVMDPEFTSELIEAENCGNRRTHLLYKKHALKMLYVYKY